MLAARLLLALAFLGVQHGATLHWLGHAIEDVRGAAHENEKPGAPLHHDCEQCDALAAFSGALPSGAPTLPSVAGTAPAPVALTAITRATGAACAYRSRAPPVLA